MKQSSTLPPAPADLFDGTPWWITANPAVDRYPPLQESISADVVVVGAGVTGALVADRLAERGADVVVLDGRQPGQGSTAASTALLMAELDLELGQLAQKIGREPAIEGYRASRRGLDSLFELISHLDEPCDFSPARAVYLASHPSDMPRLEHECRLRERAGLECELWDEATLDHETGLWGAGALMSPTAGRADPRKLTEAALRRAVRHGARVFGDTMVDRIESNESVRAVSPLGTVAARSAVLATGYEMPCGFSSPIVQFRSTYVMITEETPRAARLEPFVIWESDRPYAYLRTVGPRLLIGGADAGFDDPVVRARMLGTKVAQLQARLGRWLEVSPPPIAAEWAGTFSETTDGLPLIGPHPGLANAWLALAYGGNGITFGIVAADLLVGALLDRQPISRIFSPDRGGA